MVKKTSRDTAEPVSGCTVAGRALVGAYCAIELRLRRKILKKKASSEFLKTHGAPLTYKSLQKKTQGNVLNCKGDGWGCNQIGVGKKQNRDAFLAVKAINRLR